MTECIQTGNKNDEESEGPGFLDALPDMLAGFDREEYLKWLKGTGIGGTPLLPLPQELVGCPSTIYLKLEYLNIGESIKARTFSSMHFRLLTPENKNDPRIAATSGNYGLSGSFILKEKGSFAVYMSDKTVLENKNLIDKLKKNKVKIYTFPDGYCPAAGGKRGQAIAAARQMSEEFNYINYDQYSDPANPLAHYLTTGPEIYEDTRGELSVFLTGLGTCGSITGAGHYLTEQDPGIRIIGAKPQEDHHQLGLRSDSELGATYFYKEAKERICDSIVDVTDQEAYSGMLDLWEAGIPAGISTGTNIAAAVKIAREAEKEGRVETIVTLCPDSLENYEEFLKIHLKDITGKEFSEYEDQFNNLRSKAEKEREEFLNGSSME